MPKKEKKDVKRVDLASSLTKKENNAYNDAIKQDSSFKILELALEDLKKKYNISLQDAVKLFAKIKELVIPASIFKNNELSIFEAVCRYLKDEAKLSYHDIAVALNRDDRTIWSTYNNSLKKRKESLLILPSEFVLPISIFRNKLTILENIVVYLKDNYNLNYAKIAKLLNRDQRNIWTIYNRAKKR